MLDVHHFGDATVFEFMGRIVFPDAELLRCAVMSHTESRVVILDFARVTAIDASGVGILVALWKLGKKNGYRIKLLNLTPRVEMVLELTKVKPLFELCSVRETLQLFCIPRREPARQQPTVLEASA
jgi:anti-anti-sigma factor